MCNSKLKKWCLFRQGVLDKGMKRFANKFLEGQRRGLCWKVVSNKLILKYFNQLTGYT